MRTTRQLLVGGVLAIGFALLLACGSGGPQSVVSSDGAGQAESAPILGAQHVCYKQPDCGTCHVTPVDDHVASRSPECAACHGGNGACDPNGLFSQRAHVAGDACTSCHHQRHGYVDDADCAACHFASLGLDPACGEPPDEPPSVLLPSSELQSGCYGWPAADFTPENRVYADVGFAAGEPAVDFTLKTLDGEQVTLADLLLTKPVLLVSGSFT